MQQSNHLEVSMATAVATAMPIRKGMRSLFHWKPRKPPTIYRARGDGNAYVDDALSAKLDLCNTNESE